MALNRSRFEQANVRPKQRSKKKPTPGWRERCEETDEDGSALPLARLCLLSVADNMTDVWAKDYADNYMKQYSFRHIMGPFNCLPGDLVEELTELLCARREITRPALHLLLLPQCRSLSLESCPILVTGALCGHIAARCQGLLSLNLSGAPQLRSKVLCETLRCLPALRSLTLSGVQCDKSVIETITHCCRSLRRLDVSRCHLLSPVTLLPLGGGPTCSCSALSASPSVCTSMCQTSVSSSSSPALSPLPLTSLLALDIGLSEREEDSVFAVAYLLLSLPSLERVAMEDIGEACCLIEHRQFSQADEFTSREGLPKLEEVWRDRKLKQDDGSWEKMRARANTDDDEEEEEERMSSEGYGSDNDAGRDSGPFSSQTQAEDKVSSCSGLNLLLKDVRGLTFESLDSLRHLCPGIRSLSVTIADDPGTTRGRRQSSLFAPKLKTWSGQLQSLSVLFSGPVVDLLPALQVAGHSLVSLTLEGVKTSNDTPLLAVITACPRLKELLVSAEPPTTPLERNEQEAFNDLPNQPSLPQLRVLSINFSHDPIQRIPVMSWRSLKEVLWRLLIGSPLLEKLSLVSLPCHLDSIFKMVLEAWKPHVCQSGISSPLVPLARLQHINLQRTNTSIKTLTSLMQLSRRLAYVDVSYCWNISKSQLETLKALTEVQVVGDNDP